MSDKPVKPDYSLIPHGIEHEVAMVLTVGGAKRNEPPGARNWRTLPYAREVYYAKVRRHLDRYRNGEWTDDDTGQSNLACLIADAMILYDIENNTE